MKESSIDRLQKKYARVIASISDESDATWFYLRPGYSHDDCHSISESTAKRAEQALRNVVPCDCEDCMAAKARTPAEGSE